MEPQTLWIPEAPMHPGVYANESDMSGGKIRGLLPRAPSTRLISCARKFKTREECEAWCKEHPVPTFVPAEHQFGVAP